MSNNKTGTMEVDGSLFSNPIDSMVPTLPSMTYVMLTCSPSLIEELNSLKNKFSSASA
jgi:hypothetical protein